MNLHPGDKTAFVVGNGALRHWKGASVNATATFQCGRLKRRSLRPARSGGATHLSSQESGATNTVREQGQLTSAPGKTQSLSAFDRRSWELAHGDMNEEDSYVLDLPDLPHDLVGTLYRNGPSKFTIGSRRMLHPWEGDGAVAAFTLRGDGTVWFRNRFVRTEGYLKERRAGYQLYRGTFATPLPGGIVTNAFRLEQKNLANTNVIYHANQLLALYEGGLPYELRPDTLETKGVFRLGGTLTGPMPMFTAHPHVDPLRRGRLVGFSSRMHLNGLRLRFLEFASENWKLCSERTVDIDGFGFFHDFMITQRYYILLQAPLRFHPLPFVLGLKCPGECITWEGDRMPTRLLLIPRDDPGAPVREVLSETCTAFHFVNAYDDDDDDDDAVVLDACRMDRLFLGETRRHRNGLSRTQRVVEAVDFGTQVPKCSLWRCRIPTRSGSGTQRATWREVNTTHVDFPVVNPSRLTQPYRYVYMGASALGTEPGPLKNIIKVDADTGQTLATWQPPSVYEFAGEPVFAPRLIEPDKESAEDDGYILSVVSDGLHRSTYLVILDASDLKLVCKVPLRTFLPMGLHGTWTAQVFQPQPKRRTVQDLFESKNWNEVDSSLPLFRF
jgi:all-trans-8'-apo-beta-carotenal 15,15'-oxygenase